MPQPLKHDQQQAQQKHTRAPGSNVTGQSRLPLAYLFEHLWKIRSRHNGGALCRKDLPHQVACLSTHTVRGWTVWKT